MRTVWLLLAALAWTAVETPAAAEDVVSSVRAAIAAGDVNRADALWTEQRVQQGNSPEVIEALSWLGSGALAAGQLDRAGNYARQTEQFVVTALGRRNVDQDPHLATALANAVEVGGQVRARRGDLADALEFLQHELETYKDTTIHKKIQKNINLLSLTGHPAPVLESSEFIGPRPVPFGQLKGKVVVLFFWAHWCPDCKIEGPILADLFAKYQTQGLAIVAPTQRYGYVAAGAEAPPDEELRYIVRIRDTFYPFLAKVPVPVSEANHKRYGVSSTPTLVVLDRQGIVRLYHPGRMTREELDAVIVPLLRSTV